MGSKKNRLLLTVALVLALLVLPTMAVHAAAEQCAVSGCGGSYDNGICTLCGGCQSAQKNTSGVYEIENLGQLIWYGQNGSDADAELTADLTVGTKNAPYADWSAVPVGGGKTFDGKGHTVTLYLTYADVNGTTGSRAVGLFGGSDGTVFCNLTLKGEITCNSSYRVGAVSHSGYGVSFENILSYVDITNQGNAPTGGIVGYFGRNTGSAAIRNCAVYADISGMGDVGGLIGRGWDGTQYWTVYNSAFAGSVSGSRAGAFVGYSDTNATYSKRCVLSNSYYSAGLNAIGASEAAVGSNTAAEKTAAAFASGEVAYLLNNGVTDGTQMWYQTIGTDSYPTFSGKTVYRGYSSCADDAVLGYTNTDAAEKPAHADTDRDHLCDLCGKRLSEHDATFKPEQEATCAEEGNVAYYHCEYCGKYWTDAELTQEADYEELIFLRDSHGQTVYENNGDGTHDELCYDCSALLKSKVAHTYTDGVCVCGAACSHEAYDNGFCKGCGRYQPAVRNADGVYEIGNAGQLYWFSEKVCNDDPDINGKLIDNIIVNKGVLNNGALSSQSGTFRVWKPIGGTTSSLSYGGVFDGCGKSISGLYFNDAETSWVGVFAYVSGTVKNVAVKDTYFSGNQYVGGVIATLGGNLGVLDNASFDGVVGGKTYIGGLAGAVLGNATSLTNSRNTGSVTATGVGVYAGGVTASISGGACVKNCSNTGAVTAGGTYDDWSGGMAAGIAGTIFVGAVENCYNAGSITVNGLGNGVGGGIVAHINGAANPNAYIRNSHNVGTVTCTDTVTSATLGAILGHCYNGRIVNCYYLADRTLGGVGTYDKQSVTKGGDDTLTAVDTARMASGEVAYLLNGGVTDGTQAWYQTCGEGYPVLDGETVYCNRDTCAEDSPKEYANVYRPMAHSTRFVAADPATCTEDGTVAYYHCSVCGGDWSDKALTVALTAEELVDPAGHKNVTEVEENAPSCTEDGNIAYWHCAACGKYFSDSALTTQITEADTKLSARGHSDLAYADNGDGTHDGVCPKCSTAVVDDAPHAYADGVCICGAVCTEQTELSFFNKSLSLQSYVAFNFLVKNSTMQDYDSWYVVFERVDADSGVCTEICRGTDYNASLKQFEYRIYSYQMADELTATLYAVKDGVTYVGERYTADVSTYVMEKMANVNDVMKRLYANLLTYGAKAQLYRGYRTDHLADAALGAYAAFVNTAVPSVTDHFASTDNGLTDVVLRSNAVGIASSVQLQFVMELAAATDAANLEARIVWKHQGRTVNKTIDGADFVANALGTTYTVVFEDLCADEGRVPVSVTIYEKTTGRAVSETWTYSIESYVAYRQSADNAVLVNMLNAMMNYYDAAEVSYG